MSIGDYLYRDVHDKIERSGIFSLLVLKVITQMQRNLILIIDDTLDKRIMLEWHITSSVAFHKRLYVWFLFL